MNDPHCRVYLIRGRIFIVSVREPVASALYGKQPVFELAPDDLRAIGAKVMAAIKEYETGGPIPLWGTFRPAELDIVRADDWSDFKSACDAECWVQRAPRGYVITNDEAPSKHLPFGISDEALGEAVLQSLGLRPRPPEDE